MKPNYIINHAEEYIKNLYESDNNSKRLYHNFAHAAEVFNTAIKLGDKEGLNNTQLEVLSLAALFHDTGYLKSIDNHENMSSIIAEDFLRENSYPVDKIEKVVSAILSTQLPQSPKDIVEEILCDSDLSHIGKKSYFEKAINLRNEIEVLHKQEFSDIEWYQSSIDFFTQHKFFTQSASLKFNEKKKQNLIMLQDLKRKAQIKQEETEFKYKFQKEKLEIQKEKQNKPERGIETMFRITSQNHIQLSQMADSKAHIMISVNTILISILLSVLVRKLDANPHLIIPTLILLITSVVTIIFAVFVTKPKINSGTFTAKDIEEKKVNLLFFGNFYNMELNDFSSGMWKMMNDKEYLYGSMIKDLFFLGKVLGRKYKYINICYSVFLIGLIVSIIAYTIAIISHPEVSGSSIIDF